MIIKEEQDVRIVELPARIDAVSAQRVDETLTAMLNSNQRKLICNFVNTEYISSAGLRVLLSVLKRMTKLGGRFFLCSFKPGITEIFNMAGFVSLFTIFPSEAEALLSMGAAEEMDVVQNEGGSDLNSLLLQVQRGKAISAYGGGKGPVR